MNSRHHTAPERLDSEGPDSRTKLLTAAVLLVAAVGWVYLPVKDLQFTNWDDPAYILTNKAVLELNWESIRWAFTEFHSGNYHPLTWISHMLDVALFDLDPRGHHASALILHLLNSVLLLFVLHRLTGNLPASFLTAALFGLHPLNVESVAWVSERKNLLSFFFLMLAVDSYREYVNTGKKGHYALLMGLFGLGLLAKPMLVTFPLLLLTLDFWPLKRLSRRTLLEKLPLFALSLLSGWITLAAQQHQQAVIALQRFSLWDRFANAAVSSVRYLEKAVWPAELYAYYPLPGLEAPEYPVWVPALAVMGILLFSWWVWKERRRRPYWLSGWTWYLISIGPVIGILQVGAQGMADRYAYHSLVGPFFAVVWSMIPVWHRLSDQVFGSKRRSWGRISLLCFGISALLIALAARTRAQIPVWRNSLVLWEHTQPQCRNCFVVQFNLAEALVTQGRFKEAIPLFAEALRKRPGTAELHGRLGFIHNVLGRFEESRDQYRQAVELEPTNPLYHSLLGQVLLRMKHWEDAEKSFRTALNLKPDDPDILCDLGQTLAAKGQPLEGLDCFIRAIALQPGHEEALRLLKNYGWLETSRTTSRGDSPPVSVAS